MRPLFLSFIEIPKVLYDYLIHLPYFTVRALLSPAFAALIFSFLTPWGMDASI